MGTSNLFFFLLKFEDLNGILNQVYDVFHFTYGVFRAPLAQPTTPNHNTLGSTFFEFFLSYVLISKLLPVGMHNFVKACFRIVRLYFEDFPYGECCHLFNLFT